MSREELLSAVEKKASKYEQEYWDCSQCTLLAIQEAFGLPMDGSLKAATGFAGGIGRRGSACGGVIGGVMAFGTFFGRDLPTMKHPDPELRHQIREDMELKLGVLIDKFCKKFEDEYGSINCCDIEEKVFGKKFDLKKPEDLEEKNRLGGHDDKCPSVVGKAARWATELIMEEQDRLSKPE